MSQFVRAFLAFDIEDVAVKKKLEDVQLRLAQTGADLKLVEAENVHITVRFLGDVGVGVVDKVFEQMKKIQFKPFDVQISGLGVFPNLNFPRVVWAGIAGGSVQLQDVFTQLEPRLRALGFVADQKGFAPHLTIARVRSARNKSQLSDFVLKNSRYDFGSVKAVCLRLKRSELTPRGPIYSTLREYCPM
ncbi:MAG: RNA 2',3'-cyclic phosphodiesterase [Candidatus Bathyarchaeota archaeon]|nr:RNA 2',3'-cyclic phosphodiesterase [Candidatus Bathyarchaeota archaeon]